jgi:hypothetical protein
MVEALENWSVIRGRVRSVADDAERPRFKRVSLAVEELLPVNGFPAAVDAGASGQIVEIVVPRETADALGLADGARVELHTRATPAGLFAHPDRARVIAGTDQ